MFIFLAIIVETDLTFGCFVPMIADHDLVNANDMHVTQDLNSFREIIAHAHCSVDDKNVGCK
jgi:uncharacterized protein YutE (UPF0331/DUF86 family)